MKYRLTQQLPPYTVEQWLETYKGYLGTIYSTPKNRRGGDWNEFIKLVHEIKLFLKSKKVKFI